jgi:hypothetical protein
VSVHFPHKEVFHVAVLHSQKPRRLSANPAPDPLANQQTIVFLSSATSGNQSAQVLLVYVPFALAPSGELSANDRSSSGARSGALRRSSRSGRGTAPTSSQGPARMISPPRPGRTSSMARSRPERARPSSSSPRRRRATRSAGLSAGRASPRGRSRCSGRSSKLLSAASITGVSPSAPSGSRSLRGDRPLCRFNAMAKQRRHGVMLDGGGGAEPDGGAAMVMGSRTVRPGKRAKSVPFRVRRCVMPRARIAAT